MIAKDQWRKYFETYSAKLVNNKDVPANLDHIAISCIVNMVDPFWFSAGMVLAVDTESFCETVAEIITHDVANIQCINAHVGSSAQRSFVMCLRISS